MREMDAYGREETGKLISPYRSRKSTDWEKRASYFVRTGAERVRTGRRNQAISSVREPKEYGRNGRSRPESKEET